MTALATRSAIGDDVYDGLVAGPAEGRPKSLPPRLFYDAEGSALFEAITELPEYYPTRTERELLEVYADAIVRQALGDSEGPLHIVELGAGTATKSQIIVEAAVRLQGKTLFLPTDVSGAALAVAAARITNEVPDAEVRPLTARHEVALEAVKGVGPRRLVLFLGSSIGNFDDDVARGLLQGVRDAMVPGGAFLLGADQPKDPAVLIPAYDDAQGVTAAFNKNVLVRINRELKGHFDVEAFAHKAIWNEARSAVEMHLISTKAQSVRIDDLDVAVDFADGESIHTESSIKYSRARVESLLGATGFVLERTFEDGQGWFGLHLCRAV